MSIKTISSISQEANDNSESFLSSISLQWIYVFWYYTSNHLSPTEVLQLVTASSFPSHPDPSYINSTIFGQGLGSISG